MQRIEEILAGRTVDSLGISVGTDIAIASLTHNPKDAHGNPSYETLWINLRTLHRNVIQALTTEDRDRLLAIAGQRKQDVAETIARVIAQEVVVIRRFLADKVRGVRIYCLGYKDLLRRFPMANLRVPDTVLQQQTFDLMESVIQAVLAKDESQLIEWDKGSELRGEATKSLIITHYPVDLLSQTKFRQLRLLESHTATIKPRSQWYTKLTDGSKLSNIPFNTLTIQLFGDGGVCFNRFGVKLRRAIIELAARYRWTPVTTMDRIKFTLRSMDDRYSGVTLQRMMSS